MIRLNVLIRVKQEHRTQVIEILNSLASFSRLEEGCYTYDLYENTIDELQLLLLESWENEVFLANHAKTKHYKELLPQVKALVDEMKVEKFTY